MHRWVKGHAGVSWGQPEGNCLEIQKAIKCSQCYRALCSCRCSSVVKCLPWWKIVNQIASFKTTFSKSSNFWGVHIPPQTPTPQRRASQSWSTFLTWQIWLPHFENCSAAYDWWKLTLYLWLCNQSVAWMCSHWNMQRSDMKYICKYWTTSQWNLAKFQNFEK